MSIRIDRTRCVGCGKCILSCPGSLIDWKEERAWMRYPKDCWGCASCVKECPAGAIAYYLGADIGGNGSTLKVEYEGDILHWIVTRADGSRTVIDVNSKDANKY